MRTPPFYEEMIKEIMKVAREYEFDYQKDNLEESWPEPERGSIFNVNICLQRYSDEYKTSKLF